MVAATDQRRPCLPTGRLVNTYPFRPDMRISHEAIYHYLYVLPRGEVNKSMISLLRRSKPKRGRKTSQDELKGRIPDMIGIGERPHEVDGRLVPGHWEGDMIMGAGNRSAIGTLVERVTRYTLLVKLEFKDTDYTSMSFANLPAGRQARTACCASTFRRGRICPYSLRTSSTAALGKCSTGTPHKSSSSNLLH
jgi:IS30 family transposase